MWWNTLAVLMAAVRGAASVTAHYPWLPWLVPLLYASCLTLLRGVCHAAAAAVTRHLPVHDPAVLLGMATVAAALTVPQQRWVRLPHGFLALCVGHLVLTLQHTSAWALYHPHLPDAMALWLFAFPNLGLCLYLLARAVVLWLTVDWPMLRAFVWSAYVLSAPTLLVPQICILLTWSP